MDAWEVAARESLRDLVARYNANGDAGRLDAVVALFTPDAVVEVPPRRYEGAERIRSLFSGAAHPAARDSAPPQRIWHHTATLQIDFDDTRNARGRCYFQVLTEAGLDHWGRYLDRYRCDDGHWRFAARRVSIDGFVPGGWAAQRRGVSWGE